MLHTLYIGFIILIVGICFRIFMPLLIGIVNGITQIIHSYNNKGQTEDYVETGYPETREPVTTHGILAVLSFFIPGLGQLLKGQIGKALLFFFIGIPLGIFFMGTIIVPLCVCAISAIDAYSPG